MGKIMLFTDTSEDVASGMQGWLKAEVKHFPDKEVYCRIPCDCRGHDVLVVHRAYPEPNENLLKLFLLVDAVKSQSPSSLKVIVPYLPYARMDKKVKEGEAVSAHTICKILSFLGVDEIITLDCHFIKEGAGEFEKFGARIRNFTAGSALLDYIKKNVPDPVTVSPDQGASYMTDGIEGAKTMQKKRADYGEGEDAYRKISEMKADFDVKGRDVVIIDDMVSTGSTMIKAVKKMKEAGASRVFCATSHGLFLDNALQKLKEAGAEEVVCTDSIPNKASRIRFVELMSDLL